LPMGAHSQHTAGSLPGAGARMQVGKRLAVEYVYSCAAAQQSLP
jgi:hypothetical protein